MRDLCNEEEDPQVLDLQEDCNDANQIHSTAVIYKRATGKIAVPQHIHYAHRGPAFKEYNLFEFASIVDVVEKKNEKNLHNFSTDQASPEGYSHPKVILLFTIKMCI